MLEALTITITRHGRAPFGVSDEAMDGQCWKPLTFVFPFQLALFVAAMGYMEGRDTNGVKDKFSDVSLRSVSQQDCLAEMIIFGFRLADVSA
jgi:hypothetical protein